MIRASFEFGFWFLVFGLGLIEFRACGLDQVRILISSHSSEEPISIWGSFCLGVFWVV